MHPERISQSLAEIDALTEALKARDAETARKYASQHVKNASVVALKLLEEQQKTDLADSRAASR
ncbi:hypothetical protein D3C71_1969870 [compost metagenome]